MIGGIPVNWVAWYGAIVATLGVVFTAYDLWRNSNRLKVVAKADMRVSGGDYDPNRIYIIIEVANVGRRPITLRTLPYFQPKKKGGQAYTIKGPWLPKGRLDEGESASMFGHQDGLPLEEIRRVVVRDEAGRSWTGKIVRDKA